MPNTLTLWNHFRFNIFRMSTVPPVFHRSVRSSGFPVARRASTQAQPKGSDPAFRVIAFHSGAPGSYESSKAKDGIITLTLTFPLQGRRHQIDLGNAPRAPVKGFCPSTLTIF